MLRKKDVEGLSCGFEDILCLNINSLYIYCCLLHLLVAVSAVD